MRNLFFLLCLNAFLFSCAGSSRESAQSAPSQVRNEDKTVIELLREISLLYDDYSLKYKEREREIWDNARTKSDINQFVKNENELTSKRNNEISKKLAALKGREIPVTVIPDSIFEVTGGKILNCTFSENEVALKMTFFVKLKKDFIPDFHYNMITKKYYAPKIPGLDIKFRNSEGETRDFPYSSYLFNFDKAKKEAVRGKAYAHKGDECNGLEPGISFVVRFGPSAHVSYSDLASIEASINH
ncbi:hypothetical protein [Bacteroides faecium]|uniref:Lipoprotein n=1 Tax=Bacteroides faecium TaxID=2715212 RepID=A0A6H0KM02_9BACE|nr:hypothetical protein [Bacteroides faecium]QIU93397.1 hypothetical protein BacF7301_04170 [Bacteroides faecium]